MRTTRSLFTGGLLVSLALAGIQLPLSGAEPAAQGELLGREGSVEFSSQTTNWTDARVGLKLVVQDRLRTLALSRATLRLAELGRLRVNELTTLEILPPKATTSKATIDLKAGAIYFFTRDKPREFLLQTPYAIGASRGTEFLTVVEPSGRTVLTVFDGEVELSNSQGGIVLTNGEQGMVEAGQAPVKTAVIQATNIVQWWLYYPGVLDPDELDLTPIERTALSASLAAYKTGDLKEALQTFPTGRVPQSEDERVYYAGLLLSVGQVNKAKALLASVSATSSQARSLREVIAAVTSGAFPADPPPVLATEWLALSYVQQSTNLAAALRDVREAVRKSPAFGFAWERVAELEFSFGHIGAAKKALDTALQLSPRNAQALALRGFILSAENRIGEAVDAFEQAIRVDGALGNAWLGRGLCRIRTGDAEGGRDDLQTAAAMESNRSLLRSYLGKAFSNVDDLRHAEKELALARRLDANDPTPWLYSALLNQQKNRFNEGVGDVEKSLELNNNRRVYRSQLLLDQDRAVRSASLATIYEKAGMEEVSGREAARAVSSDYGNYSAHLFLANSLNTLRDSTLFNLRYETAWLNELLLANLLAPVGAGALSQNISQQEYSKLFEAKRLGLVSDTTWRSDGQMDTLASQFGTFGDSSYSLDAEYRHNDGVRPNNSLTLSALTAGLKQQLTLQDSILVQATVEDYHSGDNFQYYNPRMEAHPNFEYDEKQMPTLAVGYHREWSPGVHTLFLGTRLSAEQHFSDQGGLYFLIPASDFGGTNFLSSFPFNVDYRNKLEVYGAELNQIFQSHGQTLVIGGRFQAGQFEAQDFLAPTNQPAASLFAPPTHRVSEGFQRMVGYGYYTAELPANLLLTGGLAYDEITYPRNFQDVPVSAGQSTRTQLGPKAALAWSPLPETTLRGIYAKSLGGVSIDQSFRLEPVQLAGFNQSYRNIMPVSQAGFVSAPSFELFGAALDLKFKTRTYLGIQGQLLESGMDKTIGLYQSTNSGAFPATSTAQKFHYREQSFSATFNQLASDDWSFGIQYRFTRSDLKVAFPEISQPAILQAYPNTNVRADLHQVTPYLVFNHPSGFFARAEALWYLQSNQGYNPSLPGDDFYQVNLYAGYRFPRQHGDLTLGLLNVNGADYHLNPLNLYAELPRERVMSVRLRLNF